jgi:exodeoxyribonuclease-5
MRWSAQQARAIADVVAWYRSPFRPPMFRLFGFAGTGKTTLARHFAQSIDGDVAFCAYTGKAALVMRRKGCPDASTIHSLIYQCVNPRIPTFKCLPRKALEKTKLIILDEASMCSRTVGEDLLSFGVPILVLGGPAQLPPVRDAGFFTEGTPDAMLSEIHRQALDNPIIRASMVVREGGRLAHGVDGTVEVVRRANLDPAKAMNGAQILVGKNATRHAYNRRIRERLGLLDFLPRTKDKVIGLRNRPEAGLFNGSIRLVRDSEWPHDSNASIVRLDLVSEDDPDQALTTTARIECFTHHSLDDVDWRDRQGHDQFDFGYVITTHKAQGSQWDDVLLFDESAVFGAERNRWLYTGITRAGDRITVVVP